MKKYQSQDIRNVVLIAHQGAGKTSVAEAFLFVTKAVNRLGAVDSETSTFDFEPEEHKRRSTISASLGHCEWKKTKINLLDTPGDTNFFADTDACLHVADGALAVVSAADGVQVGLERSWARADETSLPRMVFINKLDRDRADFAETLSDIQETLSKNAVPVQLPIGKEAEFKGVVDLLSLKAFVYKRDQSGESEVVEIPSDLDDAVQTARQELIEAVAESDDELLEKYLDAGELSEAEIKTGLATAISTGALYPVLCGSATQVIGVTQLLDLIADELPAPSGGTVTGHDSEGNPIERERSDDAPLSAVVFKTIVDPFVGKLSMFRIYSGNMGTDTAVYNSTRRTRDRFAGLFTLNGKKQVPVDGAVAGDIVAVAKLKETHTGDTLCDEKSAIIFDLPEAPAAVISFALQPKSKGDEDKVASALARLCEEDRSLTISRDSQTKEILLSGLGQVQIEATVEKLSRKYNVEIDLLPPKIPYKETIKGRAMNIEGKHKKQSGGRGQFGVCFINLEPLPRGEGFQFVDQIVGGAIPRQFIPSVEKGIKDRMSRGVIAGYPVEDVQVTLIDGKYHDVDSDSRSFEFAGSKGFQAAVNQAKPILLEPIMELEVVCPAETMGDVIGDVNSRRGRVLGMENRGKNAVVKAQAPMAKLLKYAADLRSITSGRGSFNMHFSHNEEVPPDEAQKVIAQYKSEAEED